MPRIATGDILRVAVAEGSDVGRSVAASLEAGRLVSDEVAIGLVRQRLTDDDAQRGFVLDGFPRTTAQAVALDELMAGRDPLVVVNLVVPEDELLRRLLRRRVCRRCGALGAGATREVRCRRCGGELTQRNDDARAVITERLRVYARSTQPLVEYYGRRPTFREVAGDRQPDEVAAALKAAIASVAEAAIGSGVPHGNGRR